MLRWVMLSLTLLGARGVLRAQEQVDLGRPPVSNSPAVEGKANANGRLVPPKIVSLVDPNFSEKARKKKISGNVIVALIVDEQGLPLNVRVEKGVGYGLDEEAVKAVRQYVFRPATRDGVPIKAELRVSVNFQIF